MGTTGVVFGILAAAWLAYLIPLWMRRSQQATRPADLTERFSDDVRIVRDGAADSAVEHEVSTPITRRAEWVAFRRAEGRAIGRRRLFVLLPLVTLVVVAGLSIGGVTKAWAPAVPGALLVVALASVRFNTRSMNRQREELRARLRGGEVEDTVTLSGGALDEMRTPGAGSTVTEIALGAPKPTSALWDAVPVTNPTYVQTPTPPRTVRTIDLSAPPLNKPVTADPRSAASAAEPPGETEDGRPRAVGE